MTASPRVERRRVLIVETDRGWRVQDLHYATTRHYRRLPRAVAAVQRDAAELAERATCLVLTTIDYIAFSDAGRAVLPKPPP